MNGHLMSGPGKIAAMSVGEGMTVISGLGIMAMPATMPTNVLP